MERERGIQLPATKQVLESTFLSAEERQLVNEISGESLRPVICRAPAIRAAIEGVLRHRNFTAGGVEYFRCIINERAPGVVNAGAEVVAEAFFATDLKGMIDR